MKTVCPRKSVDFETDDCLVPRYRSVCERVYSSGNEQVMMICSTLVIRMETKLQLFWSTVPDPFVLVFSMHRVVCTTRRLQTLLESAQNCCQCTTWLTGWECVMDSAFCARGSDFVIKYVRNPLDAESAQREPRRIGAYRDIGFAGRLHNARQRDWGRFVSRNCWLWVLLTAEVLCSLNERKGTIKKYSSRKDRVWQASVFKSSMNSFTAASALSTNESNCESQSGCRTLRTPA
jgi:hypothetical protein